MIEFFTRLLDTSDYPARWHCGNWSQFEGWLHVISDILIFAAYFAIPTILIFFVIRRRDTAFPLILWLFGAFILSCGITHAIEASIFWWPAYRLSGLMKAVTAAVSLTTAVAAIRVLPEALALPSVRRANTELQDAIARERSLFRELEETRANLEVRTSQLTVRERRMRKAVSAAKACAVTWDIDSGEIIWEAGFVELLRSVGLDWDADFTDWSILVGAAAPTLRSDARRAYDENAVFHRRYDLVDQESVWDVRLTATPDPEVKGDRRTMSGLVGLVPSADSRPQA